MTSDDMQEPAPQQNAPAVTLTDLTSSSTQPSDQPPSSSNAQPRRARLWLSGGSLLISAIAFAALSIFDSLSAVRWLAFALVGLLPLVAIILGPGSLRVLGCISLFLIQLVAYGQHSRWERTQTIYIRDMRFK